MATKRGDKSTIPPGRDPIADVTYNQPPKLQPPINNLISDTSPPAAPAPAQRQPAAKPEEKPPDEKPPEEKPRKEKITVVVPDELLERIRNAAWWQRTSLATLAEEGLRHVLEKLERQHGGPFDPREDNLKPGRPLGSKNLTRKAR